MKARTKCADSLIEVSKWGRVFRTCGPPFSYAFSVVATTESKPYSEPDHDDARCATHDLQAARRSSEPRSCGSGEDSPCAIRQQRYRHRDETKDEELKGNVTLGPNDELGQYGREQRHHLRVREADHKALPQGCDRPPRCNDRAHRH